MSTKLIVERFAYTDMGTFGRMSVGGQTLYTVERPWLDNRPNTSCIPEGTYRCTPRRFNRGGYDAVEIQGVPGRSHILFHVGNTMHDVVGCIAVTHKLGQINGVWAGLHSRNAFDLFMEHYGNGEFTVRVGRYEPGNMEVTGLSEGEGQSTR
jgi:hypothetical protein